jgi:hypothetical protein
MKLIGFLKTYHSYIDEARVATNSTLSCDQKLHQNIVSYLNSGALLLCYMEMINDENPIGTLIVRTDGYWI